VKNVLQIYLYVGMFSRYGSSLMLYMDIEEKACQRGSSGKGLMGFGSL
jgi:hypothetical protein